MEAALAITFLFFNLLLQPHPFISHPQCTDSRAPFNNMLSFCPYNGNTCCNTTQDFQLQKQFRAMMNVSSPGGGRCASILKSVVCAKCDPFSGELFAIDSAPRTVPVLCNSTVSANSSQSRQEGKDFCSKVWDTCENVSVVNSPFAQSLQDQAGIVVNSNTTKLSSIWQSRTYFCNAFGGASTNESVCFDGEPVAFNNTAGTYSDPQGLCLEKAGDEQLGKQCRISDVFAAVIIIVFLFLLAAITIVAFAVIIWIKNICFNPRAPDVSTPFRQ